MELDSVNFKQSFFQADRLPEGVNGRFFIRPLLGSHDEKSKKMIYEVLRPRCALHVTLDTYIRRKMFEHIVFEESVWRR